MSAKIFSPSSSNLSLHPPLSSSSLNSSSSSSSLIRCLEITVGSHILAAVTCSYVLVFVPLSAYILRLGLQRSRSAPAATSSLDVFTYNIVAMELVGVLGCCFYCYSIYTSMPMVKQAGVYMLSTVTAGQMLFHILACLERYLAVIHPILYLRLRNVGGDRLRNISIGFVWGFSLAWIGVTAQFNPNLPTIPISVVLASSFIVASFFSLSVLCALIRPGPGEGGGDRVDLLKRRAFHTIAAITGALSLRFGGQLLFSLLDASALLSHRVGCVLMLSGALFCVPSSYVLPLLFLHRHGKLPCFKHESDGGRT